MRTGATQRGTSQSDTLHLLTLQVPICPSMERINMNLNIKDEQGVKADWCWLLSNAVRKCFLRKKEALQTNTVFIDSGNHASSSYCGVYYFLKASLQTEEVKHLFLSSQHSEVRFRKANTPVQSKCCKKFSAYFEMVKHHKSCAKRAQRFVCLDLRDLLEEQQVGQSLFWVKSWSGFNWQIQANLFLNIFI